MTVQDNSEGISIWDAAAIDDNLVAVTLPGLKQAQRIELFSKLRRLRHWQLDEKVQVGKDQEKAQSEKDSHSKNRGGKKPN